MTRAEALLRSADRREVAVQEFREELGREGTANVLGTSTADPHEVAVRAFRLGWHVATADAEDYPN